MIGNKGENSLAAEPSPKRLVLLLVFKNVENRNRNRYLRRYTDGSGSKANITYYVSSYLIVLYTNLEFRGQFHIFI